MTFERVCLRLGKIGTRMGVKAEIERARSERPTKRGARVVPVRRKTQADELRSNLSLGGLSVRPEDVLAAAKTVSILIAITAVPLIILVVSLLGTTYAIPSILGALGASAIARESLMSHPARLAARAASEVLGDSSETSNLMIMSLRHEHSVSRAITFASAGEGRFKRELKACAWGVIMGRYASFEEALMTLGQKWSRFSGDLKASLNAMVTASREATEEGRRRALDRANNAMISGAKRRIEEYALSLSMPSMLIFGLGILLPLMVGSFMPMLSWNIWSIDGLGQVSDDQKNGQTSVQTVFVMNILFPSIAALVAVNAVEKHPFIARAGARPRIAGRAYAGLGASIAFGIGCAALGGRLLPGLAGSLWMLFSLVLPAAAWLLLLGKRSRNDRARQETGYEDILFRTGASMLEGENFEYSLHRACSDLAFGGSPSVRRLSLNNTMVGVDRVLSEGDNHGFGVMNALEGIRITKQAAAKDELAAGMLAMDLAAYLKDLRDIESALRNRLRPTLSMMKTTALVLAPVVLGVTYAIYLSLGAMIGGQGQASAEASGFFLILGVFLAEMNAIVVYFMQGIEGENAPGAMAFALGAYLLASEATFAATALVASV